MELNIKNIYSQLSTVMDPETGIDLVNMGLFYKVQLEDGKIYLRMTLTSPGCPLIDTFDEMIRNSLAVFPSLDIYSDVKIDLTFDPPWVPDMMSEEAKAELGFY